MALWHIVIVLMTFWIVVLIFMGSSLHQSNETSEQTERRLFEAMQKLEDIRKENKHLKRIAAELRLVNSLVIDHQYSDIFSCFSDI